MSDQITTHFVNEFKEGITILSQQKGSRLRSAMLNKDVTGESAYMDQIGATSAIRVSNRHGDSPLVETPHARRKLNLIDVEWGDLIDDFDQVRTLNDPTNAYVLSGSYAIGREIDDIAIEKFFADALTGKDGSSTTSFPASQQIAADFDGDSTDEGLTVAKLIAAKKLFWANDVDLNMPDNKLYIGVTAEQLEDLLNTTEVTSADFNTVKALVQGEINTFMGFEFIQTERLETDGSGYRRNPVWAKSGMGLGFGMNPKGRIKERADKRFSTYVYYATSVGATRLEEDKVAEIKCAE